MGEGPSIAEPSIAICIMRLVKVVMEAMVVIMDVGVDIELHGCSRGRHHLEISF